MLAPAKMFALEDCNHDPILFVRLADGRYAYIHKWGNDLAACRSFKYLPVRSMSHYFKFILGLAIFFGYCDTLKLEYSLGANAYLGTARIAYLLWLIIAFTGVSI